MKTRKKGFGTITALGYIRVCNGNGGKILMHRKVWEEANGKIPDDKQIHHMNGDKTDNRLENLMICDAISHKKIHAGWTLIDGVWNKRCRKCGGMLPLTSFYLRKDKTRLNGEPLYKSYCKPCTIAINKKNRKYKRIPA